MKGLNNRGFLLVETVIVSVFVLTIFVMIYQNSIPMIEEYDKRIEYDDMDTIYSADLFRKLVMKDEKYSEFIEEVNLHGYKDLTNCSILSVSQQEICEALKETVGVEENNRIYLTKWDIDRLDSAAEVPRGFLEYVKYLTGQEQEKITEYRLVYSRNLNYKQKKLDENGAVIEEDKTETHYANVGIDTFSAVSSSPIIRVSVNRGIVTLYMKDDVGVVAYGINQSETEEPTYTSIPSAEETIESWKTKIAGTYYVWVKDSDGNVSKTSFEIVF